MNLLKAYRLLKSKQVGYTLVLVGKRSWLQEGLWEYLRSNFSSDEILLTGYADREDLAGIYRLADLCVFPSLSEGFGFGPLEAMRCGTAVAASRTGILTELPEESYCAVDPVNVLDIAEKICQMLGDSMQKRKQIGCALKESRQFSWEACARKTLALYRQTAA
jgi:alpha-1,3-rhamnosyl/mannosyltransferase